MLENGQDIGSARNSKLVEELEHLSRLAVTRDELGNPTNDAENKGKFKWVFMVGGNHDAPLHMLAANGRFSALLGDSVVLLQSPAGFDTPSPFDRHIPTYVQSVAQTELIASKIVNGAVRILPDASLSPPHKNIDIGVVLAGSGLSLANNAWSANRAFQISRQDEEKLQFAAEQLTMFNPDIVMTHGPPAGYGDEKKGDEHLRKVLDSQESSVKLHLFGHAHSNGVHHDDREWTLHGCRYPGRCFVNASLSTSFYVPTRLPIVFDVPMDINMCGTAVSTDKAGTGQRPTHIETSSVQSVGLCSCLAEPLATIRCL